MKNTKSIFSGLKATCIYPAAVCLSCLPSWAQVPDSCNDVTPSELQKVLLTNNLSNPMEIAVAPDNRIFIVEKVTGNVRIFNPANSNLTTALQINVFSPAHEGLIGITLDPDFSNNHYVYLYYTHATASRHELVRYTEQNGQLVGGSAVVLLEVPGIRWNNQHHSAGSMAFGPNGNLYLSTGENVDPSVSQGYASVNEADRMEDTQATSANTNDLNGKILRIHPEANGTYSTPSGNLFPPSSNAREEIYAMGMRNPFRIAIDSETGWVYWGEPGPDATSASATRGPAGRDEINRAEAPGFFGWPYFIADNLSYIMNGNTMDPNNPVNNSPNNTGLTNLPPAQPSLIAYEDGSHPQYSALGSAGGRASIMGALYRYDPYQSSPYKLPPHYDSSLFIMDWSRDWIREVKMDANGSVTDVLPFLDHAAPNGPIDMAIGPDGDMYLLEYDANSLFHIRYTGTCRIDPASPVSEPYVRLSKPETGRRLINLDQQRFITVHAGIKTAQIYNLQGIKIWETDLSPNPNKTVLALPRHLPNGPVLLVSISR